MPVQNTPPIITPAQYRLLSALPASYATFNTFHRTVISGVVERGLAVVDTDTASVVCTPLGQRALARWRAGAHKLRHADAMAAAVAAFTAKLPSSIHMASHEILLHAVECLENAGFVITPTPPKSLDLP